MRLSLLAALVAGCPMSNQGVSAEYARQVTVAQTRVAQLEQSVADSERRLGQVEQVLRERGDGSAAALENLDQVDAELRRLRGTLEDLQFRSEEVTTAVDDFMLSSERRTLYLEQRAAQVEKFLGIKPPPPPTVEDPATSPVDPVPSDVVVPETAAGKLEAAMEHMRAGRQSVARVILERAVQEHGGEPELAEIRYRLAETWFNEGDWGKAIAQFQTVVSNHRKSDWAAWAMLRQGECFTRRGEPDKARLFFEQLQRHYPKTEASAEASKLLEGLGRSPG